jgi:hypothetical protein
VSDQIPDAPPDPVASEDGLYVAIVDEYQGLRRAGAGIFAAAAITGAHLAYALKANEA